MQPKKGVAHILVPHQNLTVRLVSSSWANATSGADSSIACSQPVTLAVMSLNQQPGPSPALGSQAKVTAKLDEAGSAPGSFKNSTLHYFSVAAVFRGGKSSLSTSGLRKKPVKYSDFEVVGKHHSPFPAGSLPFTPCDRELHAAVRVRTHSLEQERHVLHVTSTQTAFHTSWPAAVGSQGAQPTSALLLSRASQRWSKVYHEGM